jgi:hypothetical protein
MDTNALLDRQREPHRARQSVGIGLVVATILSLHGAPETNGNSIAHAAPDVPRTAADLALSDWIAAIDGATGGNFTLGTTIAANATVGTNGSILSEPPPNQSRQLSRDASTAATRFVARSAETSPPAQDSARMIGSALAWRSAHAGLQARWKQYLTWGWDRRADGTNVVVVDHVGDVAAYLCGAGSTAACEITTQFLLPGANETPRLLEYGSIRDVIVDHPGVADSRGRFLALAVVRREPRSATELADLVLLGQSNPDPTLGQLSRDGGERLAAVTDTAAQTGVTGALEVSLDAAWIAANRLAGLNVEFDRYVAITNAVDESVLHTGDRVLLLDGDPVGRGMFMAIAGDPERDSWFTVIRGNSRISIRTADVELTDVQILEAARTATERPAMVVRSTTRGPSAGIVSALAYLDAITPGDLTAGLTIAGTGTVTPHGYIGNVGGTASKAAAAAEAGADVLFVPHNNLNEATLGATDNLEIVPIRSVEDALEWLTAQQ